MDARLLTSDIPHQQVITRDNVPVEVVLSVPIDILDAIPAAKASRVGQGGEPGQGAG